VSTRKKFVTSVYIDKLAIKRLDECIAARKPLFESRSKVLERALLEYLERYDCRIENIETSEPARTPNISRT